MKKRILSLVLCAAMLLSMCLFLGAGVTNSLTVCDSNGEAVKRVDLPVNQKISLTAQAQSAAENDAYQWQIQAAKNVWANILGSDTQTLELSYPMVASALSEKNTVQIRCRLTSAETGEATFSDAVTVEVTAATAVDTPASADAAAAPVLRSPAKVAAAANDAPETCTIEIKYELENGTQAAPSWTATVAKGSNYSATIPSPTVVGYAPVRDEVKIAEKGIQKDKIFYVTYKPAQVDFTVKYYQQNVGNDQYSLSGTVTKQGYTGDPVSKYATVTNGFDVNYNGFTRLLYDDTATIAADGSTVVELYYDRNYYLMNFDLDGGYGVEPIYARYDAPINVGTPTKPGYSFKGWDPELPKTMPVVPKDALPYKATWNTGTTSYTVVYWYENAKGDGYSYVADQKITNVEPGTSVSSDAYKDADFNNKDARHFTYNEDKIDNVTVKGDGSTILNVYFTRNTYTLTFKDGQKTLTCGKEEHTHTYDGRYYEYFDGYYYYGGCYPQGSDGTGGAKKPTCGKSEHTHSPKCYTTSDLTITAKYQADIHNNFPIKDGDKTIWWDVPDGCESFKADTMLGSIDTMPGESITFKSAGTQSGATLYYCIEVLPGETGTYTHDGKNFKLYKQITLEQECRLTYSEDFHNITGFTQWWSDPKFDKMEQGGVAYAGRQHRVYYINEHNYLCYTRNSYKLKFYNHNAYVAGKGGSVKYGAPLSGYNFTPDCPAEMEKNAYKFDGWYTTAGCYAGSEVNWGEATMPASDVTLYAKWVPVTHTVKTYLTENDLKSGVPAQETWTVSHGKTVEKPPKNPSNDPYTFVGWFYKDADGTEHAFDFSMPVNRDLNLYAKWIANTLMKYTIKYAVQNEDGMLTYIADDTEGSALAGSTKTFEAKTGTQLKEGYQSGYFPTTSSHSIIMDIEDTTQNEYTFVYVPKKEVKYTVRYLDKATGGPVVVNGESTPDKTEPTSKAVVTETFKQISGYAPDAYQKRLVLSANEDENVLVFWYTKDAKHAPVQIIHWTQNIAGDGYTEYQSSTNLNGVIGTEYSETPLTIAGFTYNKKPDHPVVGYPAKDSGKLTAGGLVLNLYYDRITYPYEFQFLDQETGDKLADPVKGEARYQAQVTQTAKTISGYTLVSVDSQAINIAIEDSDKVAENNVKIFYYTEQTVDIKYRVVGPTDSGTLDNYQEPQLKVLHGKANGSTPKPNDGYKFVGWYTDKDCTQPVESSWVGTGNKLTPHQVNGLYEEATYYAKFERDVFDLKITKNVTGKGANSNQTFVFTVKNKANETISTIVLKNGETKTIKGLPVGIYTVTEDTAWSWQYKPTFNDRQVTTDNIQNGVATVTFENKNNGTNWLTSLAKALNVWKNNGATVERDRTN